MYVVVVVVVADLFISFHFRCFLSDFLTIKKVSSGLLLGVSPGIKL